MKWASTIVILPLKAGKWQGLADSLLEREFRSEFLLFSPHVAALEIHDVQRARHRIITTAKRGDLVYLRSDDDAETSWSVKRMSIRPPRRAVLDGGQRFGRENIELAWAIPAGEKQEIRLREIWSFLPVVGVISPLSGETNSERHRVLDSLLVV